MHVPFVDLKAQYDSIKSDIDAAISGIVEKTAFVMGPGVVGFEQAYAEYLGVKHVIAVSDGTNAIQVTLRALGVGAGDEVIIPTHTFMATAEAVSLVGATPILTDVDPVSYHTTAELIAPRISPRTKVIMPVHLYGQAVDLDPIYALARAHGIQVVEDAAQAHGTLYRGRKVGEGGAASTFSFYPAKNLGTYGEGGAIATNDDALAERARLVRDHGSKIKYEHEIVGGNFRMSGIEGAVLSAKLPHLDGWNQRRRAHAAQYAKELGDVAGITLPQESAHTTGNYHLYVIETERRDELQAYLKARDIHTGIHYPIPIHEQKAYAHLGHKAGAFPEAARLTRRILSLPMYPELTKAQISYVASGVKAFFQAS